MSPGAFHRAILIVPEAVQVTARVEDDYHRMDVVLHHDGEFITGVQSTMIRAPWTVCPGASAVLDDTFVGVELAKAHTVGDKVLNCTHLYDLALFAAAHARDAEPTRYDVRATDPVDGWRELTLARNGEQVLRWTERDGKLETPEAMSGRTLYQLGDLVAEMTPAEAEMARILRWASLMGTARQIDERKLGDALQRKSVCFTYQRENAVKAKRAAVIKDFSKGGSRPLGEFAGG